VSTDNNDSYDFAQYISDVDRRRQNELATELTTLKMLCDPLARIGVTAVTWHYDGSCDSGDIDSLYFCTAENTLSEKEFRERCKQLTPAERKVIADADLRNAAWPFLPLGFEINDGSFGDVTLDTATRRVRVENNERRTETIYSAQEY
jgi:hypothetical protein